MVGIAGFGVGRGWVALLAGGLVGLWLGLVGLILTFVAVALASKRRSGWGFSRHCDRRSSAGAGDNLSLDFKRWLGSAPIARAGRSRRCEVRGVPGETEPDRERGERC
ncbi:hypothetical protein [Mobiluncus mulieris]|uniref:hypothetical protein n=1 Tax=Mobiluncus mulieris TaxID=2052 RepID=UPI002093EB53|nr:hypothetical protein [Mobiluncus mulieris]